jgi:hypothetical protein
MMYDRPLHVAMCSGKVGYRTWKEADRTMRRVIRLSGEGGQTMTVYRCRFCNDFHFGHDTQK